MENVQVEVIRMQNDGGGILRTGCRTERKDIVITVFFVPFSDESDKEELMKDIRNAYEKYYARVSEYL